ncbi:hypothetical protein EDE15_4073 [Edaphobacter aggregans]|uniref:Uncharacterized protein n=1 Tax=Edaphobacter aggregans TaxID=570835 RepID=A0A428MNL6_9BACT|nr:hypothetical protein EDE15_4073 [Edaphobacter aggregans]
MNCAFKKTLAPLLPNKLFVHSKILKSRAIGYKPAKWYKPVFRLCGTKLPPNL